MYFNQPHKNPPQKYYCKAISIPLQSFIIIIFFQIVLRNEITSKDQNISTLRGVLRRP